MLLWSCLPLNLLPALTSDTQVFRDAGCIGLTAGVLHIYFSSGKKTRGLKVI